jgi:hypothetical protein
MADYKSQAYRNAKGMQHGAGLHPIKIFLTDAPVTNKKKGLPVLRRCRNGNGKIFEAGCE